MKIGYLERHTDVSGVTGSGKVADLVIHPDGRAILIWPEPTPSVAVFPNLDAIRNSHGHNGLTDIVILNDDTDNVMHCSDCHASTANGCCSKHDFGCPACLSQVA